MKIVWQQAVASHSAQRHAPRRVAVYSALFATALLCACSSSSWRSSSAMLSDPKGRAPKSATQADYPPDSTTPTVMSSSSGPVPFPQSGPEPSGATSAAPAPQRAPDRSPIAPARGESPRGEQALSAQSLAGAQGTEQAGFPTYEASGAPRASEEFAGLPPRESWSRDASRAGEAEAGATGADMLSAVEPDSAAGEGLGGATTDAEGAADLAAQADAAVADQTTLADSATGAESAVDIASGAASTAGAAESLTGTTGSQADASSMQDASAMADARAGADTGEAGALADATSGAQESASRGLSQAGLPPYGADPFATDGRDQAFATTTAGEGGSDASAALAAASSSQAPSSAASGRAPGALSDADSELQPEIVGMVEAPGRRATPTEIVIPQTLGGMLPLTVGIEGEGEFDFDKAVLRDQVKSVLDRLASKLKDATYDRLEIVGHTDRVGTEDYNQYLSERRAWAVARYLIEQGVPVQKLAVEGRGMHEPLTRADECAGLSRETTIKCLQPDRRVVISASIRKVDVKVQ